MIAIVSNRNSEFISCGKVTSSMTGRQHITIEAVSFQEIGKDAFGKPLNAR